MKKIIIALGCILFALTMALGQEEQGKLEPIEFYRGGVFYERVEGTIKIAENGTPQTDFKLTVGNKKGTERALELGFRGNESTQVNLLEGENQTLISNPETRRSGTGSPVQSVSFDLVLMIGKKTPIDPPQETTISIELPKNIRLIRCNMDYERSVNQQGVTILKINRSKKYLTSLVLVFATDDVGVSMEKNITPRNIKAGADVKVNLKITNSGKRVLQDIMVEDNYDSRDFSADGPEFTRYKGEENDQRLIYQSSIKSLEPGQTVELNFTIKANYAVMKTSLSAAKATMKGRLLGVSNKVKL